MIRCCVFDFDGVIVGSNQAKRDVWDKLFELGTDQEKKIITRILAEQYPDRYAILTEYYRRLGHDKEKAGAFAHVMAIRYDMLVQKAISAIGIDPQVRRVLGSLSASYPLYINSATPECSLAQSVNTLGIRWFFRAVYGRPQTKRENMERIMLREQCSPSEIFFIGDGEEDLSTAREFGCRFVGVANTWNDWRRMTFLYPLVDSVVEIEQMLLVAAEPP